MNGFGIFMIVCALLCAFAIGAITISEIKAARNAKENPSTIEDRSGLNEFTFFDNGFMFDVSRSEVITSNTQETSRRTGDWYTDWITKQIVMVDTHTRMPFLITIQEEKYRRSVKTNVVDHRPIHNRMDMIDTIRALGSDELTKIDLDDYVYQDNVFDDEDLALASHGNAEKVAA